MGAGQTAIYSGEAYFIQIFHQRMRSIVRMLSILGIVLAILAVVSCGGSDEPVQTQDPGATTLPDPTFTPTSAVTSTPSATSTPGVATTLPTPFPTQVAPNCPGAVPASTPPGDVPPNIFLGTATFDGIVVPDGTNVTSCIDGEPVASALVSAGKFLVTIQQRNPSLVGKEVTFSIGGVDANETAVWTMGGAVLIDLSVER